MKEVSKLKNSLYTQQSVERASNEEFQKKLKEELNILMQENSVLK